MSEREIEELRIQIQTLSRQQAEFQDAAYKKYDEITARFDGANDEQHARRDALEQKLHDRIDKQDEKFTAHFRWVIGIANNGYAVSNRRHPSGVIAHHQIE